MQEQMFLEETERLDMWEGEEITCVGIYRFGTPAPIWTHPILQNPSDLLQNDQNKSST